MDNSSLRQAEAKLRALGFKITEPEYISGETVAVGSSGNPPRERAKALSYCQPQRGGGVKVLLRYFLTRK